MNFSATVVVSMQDEQPSFIRNDQELFEVASSIDPKILSHFRLLEQPYRGGPDFRYLYNTDQVQEVIIQSVQLTVSRTAPFSLTGPYGTGKSTIITRMFSLLSSKEQFDVKLIALHRGVTKTGSFGRRRGMWGQNRTFLQPNLGKCPNLFRQR